VASSTPTLRSRLLFLATVLLPAFGLVGLSLHSVSEERALLEDQATRRYRDLVRSVRESARGVALIAARSADRRLRALLAKGEDPAALRTSDPRRYVLGSALELVAPPSPWGGRVPGMNARIADPGAGDPETALAADVATRDDPTSSAPQKRVAALRVRDALVRLGRQAEARKAALVGLRAIGDGAGDSAGSTWFALRRLLQSVEGATLEKADAKLVARATETLDLARVAADAAAIGDLDRARGLESLNARFKLAAYGEQQDGWLVLGPETRTGMRVAYAFSRAGLETLVLDALAEQTGPGFETFEVTFHSKDDPIATPISWARTLGLGLSFTITAKETAAGKALGQRRAEQRLALFGGLLFVLVLGVGVAVRGVRRSAELARLRADFVASVTHELRTPVASIRAMAEVLTLAKTDDPKQRSEYLQAISDESQRLSRLIDDVLDVSRIERGAFRVEAEPTALAEVIQGVAEGLGPTAKAEGHEITLDLASDLPPCLLDRVLYARALSNLIVNAIKYAGEAKGIVITATLNGETVDVAVRDSGIGIPLAEQSRVFERFVRGSAGQGRTGSGLGLSIVQTIAEEHGGSVSLESKPGKGCTFTLSVPVWNAGP
jgi:signal transduction histidine kinase